jgi:VanZ family protein
MTIRRFALFAAWTGLVLIVFVTVSPISVRPSTVTSTDLDRAFAFCVMSALFVVAYPRRLLALTIALFLGAFLIELTQFASMTRHPQMHDAVVKALGVLVGVTGGMLVNLALRRRARGEQTSP